MPRAVGYTTGMDIALIVVGLMGVAILILWIYASLNDPKQVDEEMEAQVREETPQERERSRFEQAQNESEQNAEDIEFYSRGEDTGE